MSGEYTLVAGRPRRNKPVVYCGPADVAQTPGADATPVMESGDGPHPAHIHTGNCAELGDVLVTDEDGRTHLLISYIGLGADRVV